MQRVEEESHCTDSNCLASQAQGPKEKLVMRSPDVPKHVGCPTGLFVKSTRVHRANLCPALMKSPFTGSQDTEGKTMSSQVCLFYMHLHGPFMNGIGWLSAHTVLSRTEQGDQPCTYMFPLYTGQRLNAWSVHLLLSPICSSIICLKLWPGGLFS